MFCLVFPPKLQQQHFSDDVVLIDFNQHHEAVYRQAAAVTVHAHGESVSSRWPRGADPAT